MSKIISFILLLFLALPGFAQLDLTSNLLRGTWQANLTNPAILSDHNVTIALPGAYNNLLITGVTYNDLIVEDIDGNSVIDVSSALDKMEDFNTIREDLDIHTIGVGLRFGPLSFTFSHALRFSAFLDYPKTLPELIWEGNSQFVGQEVSFGPDMQILGYHEYALGAAVNLLSNVVVGGRVKYLNGVGDISTERTDLRLYTDEDIYQLTLNADFLLNSTGNVNYDGFTDLDFNFNFGSFGNDANSSGNSGLAFDLGANVKLGKLDLAASVLDIGKINWKQNVVNYGLNGSFEYAGLDVAQDLLNDTTSFNSTLDTLRASYNVTETANEYSTDLPMRIYLSATYALNDKITLGGLFYNEQFRDQSYSAIAVSANAQILPFLRLGAIYAYRHDKFDNLGLNAVVKLGPVQLVAATDNILTAIQLYDSNSANMRVGLNLLFGKHGPIDVNNIEDQEKFFN